MKHTANFIAADLGASSGRLMASRWNGRVFDLDEVHRFSNAGVSTGTGLFWDVLGLWSQIQDGLTRYRSRFDDVPEGIGIDAWGVDFALLDRFGRLAGNPFHYRDPRTDGLPELVFERIDEREIFAQTGVQTMRINSLFQMYSMVRMKDPQLDCAQCMLMIPDLFVYFLSGEKRVEYSGATTTQMFSPTRGDWVREILEALGIPLRILPPVTPSGRVLSPVRQEVVRRAGFAKSFPVIAVSSHDTASAVAAIPNLDESSAFISSGTWSLMGVEGAKPDTSENARRLGFTNEGGVDGSILLLRNLTGLWIVQECLRQWEKEGRLYSWSDITSAASVSRPLQSLCDPNARDFQMPGDMPRAIQDYCRAGGQSVPETAGEIARCAFESLSLKYRSVLHSLESLTGRHLTTIRVAGGGSLNGLLCQMIADACDRPVVSGPVEASALGNVMMQAVAAGHLPGVPAGRAAIADSVRCGFFTPHRSDAWDEAFARFRTLEV